MAQQIGNIPPVNSAPSGSKGPNMLLIFGVIGLVAVVIVVAMFLSSNSGEVSDLFEQPAPVVAQPHGDTEATGGVPVVSTTDHARGASNPRVIWIEYGDFECPFCKRYHEEVKQLLAAYPNDVQVIFRHFPLHIHQHAFEKAVATECAAELGGEQAFWAYHDMLYERADSNGLGISLEDLPEYAVELGINETAFSTCLASTKHDARIQGDITTGTAAGVTGTPATVIVAEDGTGTLLPGVIEFQQMQQIMDFLLNEYVPQS